LNFVARPFAYYFRLTFVSHYSNVSHCFDLGGEMQTVAKAFFLTFFFTVVAAGLARGAGSLPTIAVAEVELDGGATYLEQVERPLEVLRQEIEAALVSTRTFSVVTSRQSEIQAILDEAVSSGRSVQSVPIDFIVAPVVQAMDLERRLRPVPNFNGKVREHSEGELRMRVRVLDARSGALRAPFPVDIDWSGPSEMRDCTNFDNRYQECREDFAKPVPLSSTDFVEMAREAGRKLAGVLLDQVYPVQVISRADQQVWISRSGDAGYEVGDRLTVYSGDGQDLVHPVTGEVLGKREVLLGEIEITETRPKFSVARILSEQGGAIAAGATVRE